MDLERLYYKDAYLKEFTSRVVSCEKDKRGYALILENTAFYPEGGGQPCDLGTINGIKVTYVGEKGEDVVHYIEEPIAEGTEVKGIIDWERRFDLMQQHSAEHIVSGMFHESFGCNNVGFHMGKDMITLDLDKEITWEQVQEIERKANEYVWSNTECVTLYPSEEEREHMEYRSKKPLKGIVRLISFPGADMCACCGTHVKSSGELGIIKMFSCQKFHQGVRIEMLCGGRALEQINIQLEQNKAVSNLLSAKTAETARAVDRLLSENQAVKAQLIGYEREKLTSLAQKHKGEDTVLIREEGLSHDSVRNLANMLMENGAEGLCSVFSGNDEDGYKYAVCQKNGNLKEFIKEMNTALNGRGGGKPFFAQGSVSCKWSDIENFFREV